MPLFSILTEHVRLTWSGPPAPPDPTAPEGILRVEALRPDARVHAEMQGRPVPLVTPLHLAEQTPYRIAVESRSGAPVELRHRDPLALAGLAAGADGRVLLGTIDFGGQIGRSRFEVAVGGEAELAFEVDVLPTKVSFADVEAMRAEVEEALAGLALEYLRATAVPVREALARPPRRATWLTLLRRALPELEAALAHVAARPQRDVLRAEVPLRAEQVRRPDASVLRAVRRQQGSGELLALGGLHVREVLPARPARATLDTPEHRWLRARLEAAVRALAALQHDEAERPPTARRAVVLADLAEARRRLARLLRLPPLAAAGTSPPPAPTHRLLAAPGYAEAHAALRTLDLGLELAAGPLPHAARDLHLLYEIWAYLTVVRSVARVLGRPVPARAFFRAEHHGVRLLLRRGRRHGVAFEAGGRRVEIAYNPRFPGAAGLMAQRPDILLSDGRGRRFVLDAKYRRDDTAAYARRYGVPGPPEDALGDLHRYRDAIVEASPEGPERTVTAAVALYPHRPGEGFTRSRLWQALAEIGVGAIPLLPGETAHLEAWLRQVLA